MADKFSKEERSEIMSKVSSKDTKPEMLVRKYLFSKGFRYKKNVKSLPGAPDIVLPKYKAVIFINGCFWHHHICKRAKLPATRKDYWEKKIFGNVKRDSENHSKLRSLGWNVIVVWECEISSKKKQEAFLPILEHKLKMLAPSN